MEQILFGGKGALREAVAAEQPRAQGAQRLDPASPLPARPLTATGQEAWLVGGVAGPTNPCQALCGRDQRPPVGTFRDGWQGVGRTVCGGFASNPHHPSGGPRRPFTGAPSNSELALNPSPLPIGTLEAFLPPCPSGPQGWRKPWKPAQLLPKRCPPQLPSPWEEVLLGNSFSLAHSPTGRDSRRVCQRKDPLAQELWPAPPGWAPSLSPPQKCPCA